MEGEQRSIRDGSGLGRTTKTDKVWRVGSWQSGRGEEEERRGESKGQSEGWYPLKAWGCGQGECVCMQTKCELIHVMKPFWPQPLNHWWHCIHHRGHLSISRRPDLQLKSFHAIRHLALLLLMLRTDKHDSLRCVGLPHFESTAVFHPKQLSFPVLVWW